MLGNKLKDQAEELVLERNTKETRRNLLILASICSAHIIIFQAAPIFVIVIPILISLLASIIDDVLLKYRIKMGWYGGNEFEVKELMKCINHNSSENYIKDYENRRIL